MNSTHTPGPWEWDGNVCDYDPENEAPWLVQAPWDSKESQSILIGSIKCKSKANAKLIAAAPELLAALRDCIAALGGVNSDNVPETARKAIAKATS